MTLSLKLFLILYYIKQIDSKLRCVCSVIDHRGRLVCNVFVLTTFWRQLGIYLLSRRVIKTSLWSTTLPENKEKRFDYNTKWWTTTMHNLKLICDRRCATMSFIYFLNVWVINLDRKGFWITESEWKIAHSPTHYVRWGQHGFKTFRPSVRQKGFCRIITLLV